MLVFRTSYWLFGRLLHVLSRWSRTNVIATNWNFTQKYFSNPNYFYLCAGIDRSNATFNYQNLIKSLGDIFEKAISLNLKELIIFYIIIDISYSHLHAFNNVKNYPRHSLLICYFSLCLFFFSSFHSIRGVINFTKKKKKKRKRKKRTRSQLVMAYYARGFRFDRPLQLSCLRYRG